MLVQWLIPCAIITGEVEIVQEMTLLDVRSKRTQYSYADVPYSNLPNVIAVRRNYLNNLKVKLLIRAAYTVRKQPTDTRDQKRSELFPLISFEIQVFPISRFSIHELPLIFPKTYSVINLFPSTLWNVDLRITHATVDSIEWRYMSRLKISLRQETILYSLYMRAGVTLCQNSSFKYIYIRRYTDNVRLDDIYNIVTFRALYIYSK